MKEIKNRTALMGYIIAATLLIWLSFASARLYIFTKHAEGLINRIEPYQQAGSPEGKNILFIGDSFGYGTGASTNNATLAGLIGGSMPNAKITNKAKNGTKSEDLAQRIHNDVDEYYDIIIVIVGANDIIHPEVRLASVNNNYHEIYKTASQKSDHVIAITTSNFKDVSFFAWPLNHYFGNRSNKLNRIAKEEANKFRNVTYIDAFSSGIYPKNPKIFESEDRLHPNDLGTYYWHKKILQQTNDLSF